MSRLGRAKSSLFTYLLPQEKKMKMQVSLFIFAILASKMTSNLPQNCLFLLFRSKHFTFITQLLKKQHTQSFVWRKMALFVLKVLTELSLARSGLLAGRWLAG